MRPVEQRGCGTYQVIGTHLGVEGEEFQLRRVSSSEMVMGKPGVDVTNIVQDVFSILWGAAHPLTRADIRCRLAGSAASFLIEGLDGSSSPQAERQELLGTPLLVTSLP